MISANREGEGTKVIIKSTGIPEEIEELTAIIRGVRHQFTEMCGEEFADAAITFSGKVAYTEDDDEIEELTKEFSEWLDKKTEDLVMSEFV